MHRPLEAWKDIKQPRTPPVRLVRSAFLTKGTKCRYLVVDQPHDMTEFCFRVHVSEGRYFDEKNLMFVGTGSHQELLEAFETDLESVKRTTGSKTGIHQTRDPLERSRSSCPNRPERS